MPKIAYTEKRFSASSTLIIEHANRIITDYTNQGFALTLRQLYYRFVAGGLLANKQTEYKRLGSIINDARLAGLIDWDAIEDRGRNLISWAHWDSPAMRIASAARSYAIDVWENQPYRVEVWVEKQALESVVENACSPYSVPCYACKGYVSQSEMWRAAQRFRRYLRRQDVAVIHLGDHDPSGIDMSRDIRDRLTIFRAGSVEVDRIALNFDQIEAMDPQPPPNPAKLTDSRVGGYLDRYGNESWELDAVDPAELQELIHNAIHTYIDDVQFRVDTERQTLERQQMIEISRRWDEIEELLEDSEDE